MRLLYSLLPTLLLLSVSTSATAFTLSDSSSPPAPKGAGAASVGRGGSGRGASSGSGSAGHDGSSGGSNASGLGRGGSGGTGHSAVSYGSVGTGGRNANFFSVGGGSSFSLPQPSVFTGRQIGGGTREDVSGTPTYGSEYPTSYSPNAQGGVAGRGFPFGFWPLYWSGHGHSDEYGSNATVAAQRPGGSQVIVQLSANSTLATPEPAVANKSYWMIGDNESVTVLLSILSTQYTNSTSAYGCGVQNATISPFDSSNASTPVQFSNVIQWYRASSFALASSDYNNTNASNDAMGVGWNASTPIPSALSDSALLQCINRTIFASLPIIDAEAPPKLGPAAIAGIVIGCIFGSIMLFLCFRPYIYRATRGTFDYLHLR